MSIAEVPCLFRFVLVGAIQRDFAGVFNKTTIPLGLVGYEMIIANSVLCASLAIYHLISNTPSWNNCYGLFNSAVRSSSLIIQTLQGPSKYCVRGTEREYSSKPLKHSIVKRILVFYTVDIGIFLSPKNFSPVRIS